jgi:hypothetical protein
MTSLKKHAKATEASYVTDDEKATACAHAIWTEGGVSSEPTGDVLAAPRYDPPEKEEQYEFNPVVTPDEVGRLLRRLLVRKAPDKTGLSNRALTMLAASEGGDQIFERYLADLFTACLYNNYFPDHWKTGVTHMVPKPEKVQYDLVKSWRPIALLSVVGKLLEKIVATRFTTLAVEHGLIDPRQYCFAGRSTQDALVYNLDFIYEGWLLKKKVSQLFLDMTGAYDRVIRQS